MNHPSEERSVERIRKLFGRAPNRLQVAALPWRRVGHAIEIMLITSRSSGRWVLPKGWPEKKETLWDSAAREAGEEAGLKGAISDGEIGRYYYAKTLAGAAYEVRVFPMKVKEIAGKWPEARERRRRWMRAEAAAAAVREPDLAAIILAFSENMARKAA